MSVPDRTEKSAVVLLSLIIGLGTALRLWMLTLHFPWFDEVLCIFQSEHLQPLLNGSATSNNPPLFYLLLFFWRNILNTLFFMRLFSVICGVLSIGLIYYLGKLALNRNAGLVAALLLAVSPIHTYYSREIKMYSLNVLLALITMILTFRYFSDSSKKNALLIGVVNALMLYTHYYLFLMAVTVNLIILSDIRRFRVHVKNLLIADMVTAAFFIPWSIVYFSSHLGMTVGYVSTWIPVPTVKHLFYTLKNFITGFHSIRIFYWPATFISIFVCFYAVIKRKKFSGKAYRIVAITAIFPIAFAFLLSQFRPLYLDRYLLFSLPAFLLLLGGGLTMIPGNRRGILTGLLIFLTLPSFPNLYKSRIPFPHQVPGEHERPPFRAAVNYIASRIQPDEKLFHISRRTNLSFEYAWPGRRRLQPFWTLDALERYPEPRYWPHSNLVPHKLQDEIHKGDIVWAVLCDWVSNRAVKYTQEYLESRGKLLLRETEFRPIIIDKFAIEK